MDIYEQYLESKYAAIADSSNFDKQTIHQITKIIEDNLFLEPEFKEDAIKVATMIYNRFIARRLLN